MPIYEYLCESCGRITEVIHKIAERRPSACGECGSAHVARLVSRSAFQLKGGGWYADLYASRKKDGRASGEKAEKAEPAGGESKPAAGGESKPAAGGAKQEGAGAAEKKPSPGGAGEKGS